MNPGKRRGLTRPQAVRSAPRVLEWCDECNKARTLGSSSPQPPRLVTRSAFALVIVGRPPPPLSTAHWFLLRL
jgi:hypothetical protein